MCLRISDACEGKRGVKTKTMSQKQEKKFVYSKLIFADMKKMKMKYLQGSWGNPVK